LRWRSRYIALQTNKGEELLISALDNSKALKLKTPFPQLKAIKNKRERVSKGRN
jgi:hypothetical protein